MNWSSAENIKLVYRLLRIKGYGPVQVNKLLFAHQFSIQNSEELEKQIRQCLSENEKEFFSAIPYINGFLILSLRKPLVIICLVSIDLRLIISPQLPSAAKSIYWEALSVFNNLSVNSDVLKKLIKIEILFFIIYNFYITFTTILFN